MVSRRIREDGGRFICLCDSIGDTDFEPLVSEYAVASGGGVYLVPKHSPGAAVYRLEAETSMPMIPV